MKNRILAENIKKLIEYCGVMLVVMIATFPQLLAMCRALPSFTFDSQNLLMWDILSSKGYIPYRDLFYPYSLLTFYKNSNLIWHGIYIIIIYLLFLIFFYFFQKLFSSRLFNYTAFIALVAFISFYSGFETFSRYGLFSCMTFLLAYFFSKKINLSYTFTFLLGILSGIIFILYTDQGVYSFFLVILFTISNPLLFDRKLLTKPHYYRRLLVSCIFLLCGFLTGILPLVIWLYQNQALHSFLATVTILSSVSLSAKIPFLLFFFTRDNLFTFFFLFIAIFVSFSQFFSLKRNSFIWRLQIGLVICLIVLEQKNILRPIDTQLTFIAFLLFFVLFTQIKTLFEKYNISTWKIYVYFLIILIVILFHFRLGVSGTNRIKTYALASCFSNNGIPIKLQNEIMRVHPDYKEILATVPHNFLSFPEDPLLYVNTRGKLPYFLDIYTATSERNQWLLISYIEKNNVDTVVYNTNILTHDMVPDYIRGKVLLSYLLTHFHITKSVHNYLILEKNNPGQNNFNEYLETPQFHNYLLNVDLASLPMEDGTFDLNVKKEKIIYSNISEQKVNIFLKTAQLSSGQTIISLTPTTTASTNSVMFITTADNITTSTRFTSCIISHTCLIDLSRVPLFFTKRNISHIHFTGFKGNITFIKIQ